MRTCWCCMEGMTTGPWESPSGIYILAGRLRTLIVSVVMESRLICSTNLLFHNFWSDAAYFCSVLLFYCWNTFLQASVTPCPHYWFSFMHYYWCDVSSCDMPPCITSPFFPYILHSHFARHCTQSSHLRSTLHHYNTSCLIAIPYIYFIYHTLKVEW
jgi:hypothetical protein